MGLQKHLHRFNMCDQELCDCQEDEESVEHYLLHCNLHLGDRSEMLLRLGALKVQPTLQNILGGGNFSSDVQHKIVETVVRFLKDTKKLALL